MPKKNEIKNRVGEIAISNEGYKMKIIACREGRVDVKFLDEHGYIAKNVFYVQFKDGRMKNPWHPSIFQHGCLGTFEDGSVPKATEIVDGKKRRLWEYVEYTECLRRRYDEKFQERQPTYKGCTADVGVFDIFANFIPMIRRLRKEYNFPKDMKLRLDKDILKKGNKHYSEENCVLIPQALNSLFTKRGGSRGELPIGVTYNISHKQYQAQMSKNNSHKNLGYFNTPEEAFNVYKIAKEQYIKQIADDYVEKGWITKDSRLYKALYRYEVEIND